VVEHHEGVERGAGACPTCGVGGHHLGADRLAIGGQPERTGRDLGHPVGDEAVEERARLVGGR
jgi:hypothetical protein